MDVGKDNEEIDARSDRSMEVTGVTKDRQPVSPDNF